MSNLNELELGEVLKLPPYERAALALHLFAQREYGRYGEREHAKLALALDGIPTAEAQTPSNYDWLRLRNAKWRHVIESLTPQSLAACKRGAMQIASGSGRAPIRETVLRRIEELFGGLPLGDDCEISAIEREASAQPYHECAPQFRLTTEHPTGTKTQDVSVVPWSANTRGFAAFDFATRTQCQIAYESVQSITDLETGEFLSVAQHHYIASKGNRATALLQVFEARRICWVLTEMLRTTAGKVSATDKEMIRAAMNAVLITPADQATVAAVVRTALAESERAGGVAAVAARMPPQEREICLDHARKMAAFAKGGEEFLDRLFQAPWRAK